jgi:hypothetical protein
MKYVCQQAILKAWRAMSRCRMPLRPASICPGVPPTIQTTAEEVAWSYPLSVEDYHPAQAT